MINLFNTNVQINNSHLKQIKVNFLFVLFMILVLFSVCIFSGCGVQSKPISQTGFHLNTVISITIYDKSKADVLEECFSLCENYENMFSKTIEGSDVWNINHALGTPVTVSDDTITLIETASKYSSLTDGLIDITIEPLSTLWNFSDSENTHVPSEDELNVLLPLVDYKNMIIEENTVTLLNPDASIDLGFIAKGYIADRLKEHLLANNVEHAIINLGGNVLTIGNKPDGSLYTVGIQKPFDERNAAITTLNISDQSVVSSGVYERYFETNGTLYHHILDAKTGYPIRNNLLGVTIISDYSLDGDALSTTCFVLGLEHGMQLIENLENVEAVFITDDYELHYSSGF